MRSSPRLICQQIPFAEMGKNRADYFAWLAIKQSEKDKELIFGDANEKL